MSTWDSPQVPDWPLIQIQLGTDPVTGEPQLYVDEELIDVPAGEDFYRVGIATAAAQAAHLGRPVRAVAQDDDGQWLFTVNPDGSITDPDQPGSRSRRPQWTMPAGLSIGIAGLILLIGLATSVIMIKPAADHTAAPPAPASSPVTERRTTPPLATTPVPGPSAITPASGPAPLTDPTSGLPAATPAPPTSASVPNPTITFPGSARTVPTPVPTYRAEPPSTEKPRAATQLTSPRASPPTVTITEAPTATQPPTTTVPAPTTPGPGAMPQTATVTPQPPNSTGQTHITGNYCLSVENGAVHAQPCANDITRWSFQNNLVLFGGSCLTLDEGPYIHLIPCTGTNTQNWTRRPGGQLKNMGAGTCLGIERFNGAVVTTSTQCTD